MSFRFQITGPFYGNDEAMAAINGTLQHRPICRLSVMLTKTEGQGENREMNLQGQGQDQGQQFIPLTRQRTKAHGQHQWLYYTQYNHCNETIK